MPTSVRTLFLITILGACSTLVVTYCTSFLNTNLDFHSNPVRSTLPIPLWPAITFGLFVSLEIHRRFIKSRFWGDAALAIPTFGIVAAFFSGGAFCVTEFVFDLFTGQVQISPFGWADVFILLPKALGYGIAAVLFCVIAVITSLLIIPLALFRIVSGDVTSFDSLLDCLAAISVCLSTLLLPVSVGFIVRRSARYAPTLDLIWKL